MTAENHKPTHQVVLIGSHDPVPPGDMESWWKEEPMPVMMLGLHEPGAADPEFWERTPPEFESITRMPEELRKMFQAEDEVSKPQNQQD